MIYLATPYSHPNEEVRALRFLQAYHYCCKAMQKGEVIFSPIVYGHRFADLGDAQTDHVWWQDFNESILIAVRELRVLKLEGWDQSLGIQHELDFADRNGIEVTYESL